MATGQGDRRRDGGVGGDDPAAACRTAFLFLEKERELRVAGLYHEHRRDRYRDLILLTGLIGLQCEYLAGSIGPGASSRPGPPMTVTEAIESPPAAWARSWAFQPMRELRVAYGRYTAERRRLGMWLSSRSKSRAEIEAEGVLEEIADRVARLVGGRRHAAPEAHRPMGKRAPRPIRPLPMGGPADKPIAAPTEKPIVAPFDEPPFATEEPPPTTPDEAPAAPTEEPPTASVAAPVAVIAAPKPATAERPKPPPVPSVKPVEPPRYAQTGKPPVPFATKPPERRRNWKALLVIDIAAAAGIAIAVIALWGGFGSSDPSDQPDKTKATQEGAAQTPLVRPLEGPLRGAVADGPHRQDRSKPGREQKPQHRDRTPRSAPAPATSVPASSVAETTTPTVAAAVPATTTPAATTPAPTAPPPSSSSSGESSSSSSTSGSSSCQPQEFGFEC